jgi:hypothetical protein
VRWNVHGGEGDCRVAWRLEPAEGENLHSTVRVDAGGQEQDNRRYEIDSSDATFVVTSTCPRWAMSLQTSSSAPADADCDSSYPDVCIPPYPPDLDCPEIEFQDFAVVGSDPHGFDREGDGIGCES